MKNRPDRSATRRVGMSACAMLLGMMLSSGAAAQDAVSFGKKCSASFKSGVDLDDVVDGGLFVLRRNAGVKTWERLEDDAVVDGRKLHFTYVPPTYLCGDPEETTTRTESCGKHGYVVAKITRFKEELEPSEVVTLKHGDDFRKDYTGFAPKDVSTIQYKKFHVMPSEFPSAIRDQWHQKLAHRGAGFRTKTYEPKKRKQQFLFRQDGDIPQGWRQARLFRFESPVPGQVVCVPFNVGFQRAFVKVDMDVFLVDPVEEQGIFSTETFQMSRGRARMKYLSFGSVLGLALKQTYCFSLRQKRVETSAFLLLVAVLTVSLAGNSVMFGASISETAVVIFIVWWASIFATVLVCAVHGVANIETSVTNGSYTFLATVLFGSLLLNANYLISPLHPYWAGNICNVLAEHSLAQRTCFKVPNAVFFAVYMLPFVAYCLVRSQAHVERRVAATRDRLFKAIMRAERTDDEITLRKTRVTSRLETRRNIYRFKNLLSATLILIFSSYIANATVSGSAHIPKELIDKIHGAMTGVE